MPDDGSSSSKARGMRARQLVCQGPNPNPNPNLYKILCVPRNQAFELAQDEARRRPEVG